MPFNAQTFYEDLIKKRAFGTNLIKKFPSSALYFARISLGVHGVESPEVGAVVAIQVFIIVLVKSS